MYLTLCRATAEHQSRLLARLRQDFALEEEEQKVLARGRNAVSGSSRNRRDPSAYQDATALEALIGYLYIVDQERCKELLDWIQANVDS